MPRPSKLPAIIKKWIDDEGQTEEEMRDYILRSLEGYRNVTIKATTEAGWISFKLGCNLRSAVSAIKWQAPKTRRQRENNRELSHGPLIG
jgi:hypothetical protein